MNTSVTERGKYPVLNRLSLFTTAPYLDTHGNGLYAEIHESPDESTYPTDSKNMYLKQNIPKELS